VVRELKRDFPALTIVVNGGLSDVESAARELPHVDGAMLGRAAYHEPYLLAGVDAALFGDARPPPARAEVLEAMMGYASQQVARGVPLRAIARHMLGLYHGRTRGRLFRQILSDAKRLSANDVAVLRSALEIVEPAAADAGAA